MYIEPSIFISPETFKAMSEKWDNSGVESNLIIIMACLPAMRQCLSLAAACIFKPTNSETITSSWQQNGDMFQRERRSYQRTSNVLGEEFSPSPASSWAREVLSSQKVWLTLCLEIKRQVLFNIHELCCFFTVVYLLISFLFFSFLFRKRGSFFFHTNYNQMQNCLQGAFGRQRERFLK